MEDILGLVTILGWSRKHAIFLMNCPEHRRLDIVWKKIISSQSPTRTMESNRRSLDFLRCFFVVVVTRNLAPFREKSK